MREIAARDSRANDREIPCTGSKQHVRVGLSLINRYQEFPVVHRIRLGLAVALFAVTAIGVTHPSVAQEMSERLRVEGIHWPGEGGKRLEVSVGMYLIDFARINLREESFDMAGYLDATWVDPGLALKASEAKGKIRRFRPNQVWTPALEFVNAVEQVLAEREGDLYVDDNGRAKQRIRFSHKFQSTMDLKRFPFDSQTLSIVVAPFDLHAKDIDLVIDPARMGRLKEASVTDWDIEEVSARLDKATELDPTSRFLFDVKLRRHSTFYLWRILLPMTLLVFASWIVFWFEPTNLQPQISTGLAILLSLVTFTYAIDFSLPKVAYLTFIDRHVIASFLFVLATVFAVAMIHIFMARRGPEAAFRLQRRARIAFPAAFLLVLFGLSFASFR